MSAAAIPCSLPDRLGPILEGLRRLIALRAGQNHALIPWVVVLWGRLGRTLARVAAIAARHQAGTLRRPAKPRERTAPPAPSPRPPPPRDPLPRSRGWLVRRIRESGCYGEHLRLLLEEPDTRALIEAAPQLRRHLRPLWRMLRRDPVPEILRSPPAARALRRPRKRRETPPPRAAASPPPPSAPRPAPSAPRPVPPAIRRIAGHAFNRG